MRFAADENFDGDILAALRARLAAFDVVRVQDTEMYQSEDPELLEWLAKQQRILLTHDINTMPGFLYDRVRAGQPSPGIIVAVQNAQIGLVIDDLEVAIGAGQPEDFENQVKYIPIR